MLEHVTRCPHCHTSFRVRSEHLDAAKGMVRCGSCLQVFKAANFFIEQPSPESEQEDDLLIHDDMDLETEAEAEPESESSNDVFSDDPTIDYNLRAPDKQSRPTPRNSIDFGEIVLDLEEHTSIGQVGASAEEQSQQESEEDSWANALLEEEAKAPTRPSVQASLAAEPDDYIDDFDQFEHAIPQSADSLIVKSSKGSKSPLFSSDKIADLQDDPLELHSTAKRKLPWLWMTGSLLLLLLSALQFLYFNFSQLSRTPTWRPVYLQACHLLGCELPKIQNTQQMATQLFTVQSHPQYNGALLVETLLLNKATYAQPFPDILLTFKDLNERIIASRRFTPSQYLSGEMAGISDMPEKTPIHIALEIVDPGAEAVSFTINLLANH